MGAALPEIRQARTRADSLALGERFAASPPDGTEACGRLLKGFLDGMNADPAQEAWRSRQQATQLLEQAVRDYPDEPRLYMALAVLLHYRQARTDALRMLDRAVERRDQGEVPLSSQETALLYYERGSIDEDFWRDWRSYGQLDAASMGQWRCSRDQDPTLDNFSSTSGDFTWLIPVNQLCSARFAENMAKYFRPRADMNLDVRDDMERAFLASWEADTTFWAPVEALLSEYVYAQEWAKADTLTQRMVARFPDNVWPRLYRGLVLHETGRDSLASVTFASARAALSDSLSRVLDDIRPLLSTQQTTAYDALDENGQQAARIAFWTSLDPLFLTTWNERRIEHAARVVTAGLLFSGTTIEGPGWQTFAGQTWIRYGRPIHMWELAMPAGRVVFWDYGPGPDITFKRGFNYRNNRPTDEAFEISNKLKEMTPQTYALTGLVDSVTPLDAQLVRTLGPGHKPQILVYGEWPEGASADAQAGLTLLDRQYFPVAQWRGRKPTRAGIATELNGMAAGAYSLTLEVWDKDARRLYRVRDTVSTLAASDKGFGVSDILLATEISAPSDAAANRRELTISPVYGSTIQKGQPLGLVWETYRLNGKPEDRERYHVSVELLDASRQPVLARVLRGVGISGERQPETRIEYESTRPVVDGRTVEWLELTSDLGIGEYRLVLRIKDQETGHEVTRERSIRVR